MAPLKFLESPRRANSFFSSIFCARFAVATGLPLQRLASPGQNLIVHRRYASDSYIPDSPPLQLTDKPLSAPAVLFLQNLDLP